MATPRPVRLVRAAVSESTARTCAANEQRAISLTGSDLFSGSDGDVRVVGLVGTVHPDVDHLVHARVLLEQGLECILVLHACLVCAYDDCPAR